MADSNSPEANFRLGNVTATVWSNESSSANGNKKFRTVKVTEIAAELGTNEEALLEGMTEAIPQIVDESTTNGSL